MNIDILDKRIIYINSSNCKFLDNTFTFYYDLLEPIRNVVYIKLMKAEIIANPSLSINGVAIQDGDPVFIDLNSYDRMFTNIIGNNAKCFDCITFNITDKYGANSVPNKLTSFKIEYNSTGCSINDTNTFVLDPVEPNLRLFNITLYDKKFKVVPKTDINVFNMILCVYSSRKKVTMM